MKQNSVYLSQVIYCGGYSGDEPPLTIPNREVKLTSADGTAPPGGRVGRCRFSEPRLSMSAGVLSLCVSALRELQPPRPPWSGGRYAPQAGTPCRFSECPCAAQVPFRICYRKYPGPRRSADADFAPLHLPRVSNFQDSGGRRGVFPPSATRFLLCQGR